MKVSPKTYAALDACHDASLGFRDWDFALQELADAFGATSCVLIPLDQDVSVKGRSQLESRQHAPFTELWLNRIEEAPDPHTTRPSSIPIGRFPTIIEHQITTETERKTLAYYRAIATVGNREWWAAARFRTRERNWALPLYRSADQGPFTLEDARRIDKFIPTIRRFVATSEALEDAKVSGQLQGLSDFGCAAFVLDRNRRVLQRNSEADRLLGSNIWIARSGRLSTSDPDANHYLNGQDTDRCASTYGSIVVQRDGLPWLLGHTLPLSLLTREIFTGGRSILLLRQISAKACPDPGFLRRAFELTPAEARLATHMSDGKGLDAACDAISVGKETGRSQLRSIFGKTMTRSQAELAALLTRLNFVKLE